MRKCVISHLKFREKNLRNKVFPKNNVMIMLKRSAVPKYQKRIDVTKYRTQKYELDLKLNDKNQGADLCVTLHYKTICNKYNKYVNDKNCDNFRIG